MADSTIINQIKREIKIALCKEGSKYTPISQICGDESNIMDGFPLPTSLLPNESIPELFPPIVLTTSPGKVSFKYTSYIVPCSELPTFHSKIPNFK